MDSLSIPLSTLKILNLDTTGDLVPLIFCDVDNSADYMMSANGDRAFVFPLSDGRYENPVYEANYGSCMYLPPKQQQIMRKSPHEEEEEESAKKKKRKGNKRNTMEISSETRKPFRERVREEDKEESCARHSRLMGSFPDYTDGSPEQWARAEKFLNNVYRILDPYVIDDRVLWVVGAALKFIFRQSRSLANTLEAKGGSYSAYHGKTFKRQLKFILSASDPYPRIG